MTSKEMPTRKIDFDLKGFFESKKYGALTWPPTQKKGEKRYYLKHKVAGKKLSGDILNDELKDAGYLNRFLGEYFFLSAKGNSKYYQTKFTTAEIESIKERFNVMLEDFEFIEVEEAEGK